MTRLEVAFRHIAQNDFNQRLFARDALNLIDLCARKGTTCDAHIAAAVGAYFDEIAQEQAARLGLCRLCRVRRPTHFHFEPVIRSGVLAEKMLRCGESHCRTLSKRSTATCDECLAQYRQILQIRHEARRQHLRRRGATVASRPWILR